MRRTLFIIFSLIAALLAPLELFCCTSAIFSGRTTASGRPIIWKNRDTGFLNNRLEFVRAGEGVSYGFIYLSNSKSGPREAWSGLNSEGFSIINTVSYNIRRSGDDTPASRMDREGIVMYDALATCATLADFEALLDSLEAPYGIEANFGVIDGRGGAAYYEVNNFCWKKYDVNDTAVAPDGYLVRSNYSFSGSGEGQGYARYNSAVHIINERLDAGGKIDVRFVMDSLSRGFYQSEFGCDPYGEGCSFFADRNFIPRKSTASVTIAEGVAQGCDPSQAVFWCALGYPPVSEIVPTKVSAGDWIPASLVAGSDGLAAACSRALERKKMVFSIDFSDGVRYVDFNVIRKEREALKEAEDKIFDNFASDFNPLQMKQFYEEIEIR